MCADISLERAEETVGLLAGRGYAVQCDVADRSQVEDFALFAELQFGGAPTVVINNAGVGIGGQPVGNVGLDNWNWALGINLWGVIHGCETFIPQLLAAGRGGVVNVALCRRVRCRADHGLLQRRQGRCHVALGNLGGGVVGNRCARERTVPDIRQDNVAVDGRITAQSSQLAQNLMRWTGFSPERVAVGTLDAFDKGRLYVVPQLDAKAIWLAKRLAPTLYARGAGLLNRLMPNEPVPHSQLQSTSMTGK